MKKFLFSLFVLFCIAWCGDAKNAIENTVDTTAKNVSAQVETVSDAFQDVKDRTQEQVNVVQSGVSDMKNIIDTVGSGVENAKGLINSWADVVMSGASMLQNRLK